MEALRAWLPGPGWFHDARPQSVYFTVAATVAATYILPRTLRYLLRDVDFRDRIFGGNSGVEGPEEPDVVYFFLFPRSCTRQVLNLSPFAIKLESWLRLNKIPYKAIQTLRFSRATKQIPYIHYNGEEITDTPIIMDYLMEKFGLDPLEGGTEEELGISRAFHRMADESLALTYFWFRYHYLADNFDNLYRATRWKSLSKFILRMTGKGINTRAVAGGLGRHTPSEIGEIGQEDIRAISRFLGTKQFMFGDRPRTLDCVMFCHLSQIMWVDMAYPHKEVLRNECENLLPYMERLKALWWPDWKSLVNEEPFSD